jgi:hypothetical protein
VESRDDTVKFAATLGLIYRGTWPACLRLWLVSTITLSVLGLALVPYRGEILDSLLAIFFPRDWLSSFEMANAALFHSLGGVLLFQTVAIVCFSTISVLFFPFRDRISVLTEKLLRGEAAPGPGLPRELWLEAGLVLIAFNVYSAIYLLAYFIGQSLMVFIGELAFLLLLSFFILDLLSPVLFRRNLNCLYVLGAIRRQPLKIMSFGVVFCLPVFILELFLGGLVYKGESELLLAAALVAIIFINCTVCVFALPMGTWLALSSIQDGGFVAAGQRKLRQHRLFFLGQLIFTLFLALFYGSVVGVLSSKVPLKTADYDIQWRTMGYESGSGGEAPTLRFDMQVFNRHQSLGLEVDNANLLINLDGRYLGEAGLDIPYVAPKTSVVIPVKLQLALNFSELAGIASQELFSFFTGDKAAWRNKIQARLLVQLPLGLQFPVYLPEGYRQRLEIRPGD